MARRRRFTNFFIGAIVGVVISSFMRIASKIDLCDIQLQPDPQQVISAQFEDNSKKNLLFVGVMTASKYLDTRAKAAYETWGKEVPGKIEFFSSEMSTSKSLPLISLRGVDDSYPPQKKSFTMLKYMHDNYIDVFEWFLRADDDVYIRMDQLEELLRSVDSRKPWFIGQTGRGNQEELGLLSLENDENFCMGGPGVIFSRETLRRIAPHVDDCLQNLVTSHEDVEVGRCVRKFAGVSCTWSYEASPTCGCEMQVILYHNQSGEAAFSGDLKQKEVHHAITMHPVKHPRNVYRLHNYVKGLQVQEKHQHAINLHRDIALSMSHVGIQLDQLSNARLVEDLPLFQALSAHNDSISIGDPEVLGAPISLNRFKPNNVKDILEWELIAKSLYSYKDANPRRRIGSSLKEGLGDVVREVMDMINVYSKQRGRIIDFKEIIYGYWRLDPLHGADLIIDLSLVYKKYRGHKMTVPVRRHAYIQQSFTGLEIRETNLNEEDPSLNITYHKQLINHVFQNIGNVPLPPIFGTSSTTNKKCINFILPLNGRFAIFQRFLQTYEDVCIKQHENTRLFIVLYADSSIEDFHKSRRLIGSYKSKYGASDIDVRVIRENFARGRALRYGVDMIENDGLMFFVDVDIVFSTNSLNRIRYNTARGKHVYFPIVYSLYKFSNGSKGYLPESESSLFNVKGFWRQFGFGIASLYKSDFANLGGFNTSIRGWGLEDVSFYDSAINSQLKIIRAVDPGLTHVYHSVECNDSLERAQKEMCLGTKANIFAALEDLQQLYLKYRHLLS